MGKKRKHSETQTAEPTKKDEGAPERPKRTLLGWKDKEEVKTHTESNPDSSQVFRNKEKVMVTCSRRINYRLVEKSFFSLSECLVGFVFFMSLMFFFGFGRYRHLMLNMVSLLPHCKKDNKVESSSSKGATLNELIELRGCSSALFFEVNI